MCYFANRAQAETRLSKLYGWIPIILFTLVFGLRYGVGMDYNNYVDIYEQTAQYTSLGELLENERYEFGFSILLFICHFLGAPDCFLFIIIAFIQIYLLYATFKEENNVLTFIYAAFILTGFCMYNFMNILRHDVAFCIFIYSLKYIKDNKLIPYLLCCVLALSFHHSALILFPLYFVWIKRKSLLNKPLIEAILVIICFCASFISSWQDLLHNFDGLIILLGYGDYIDIVDDMKVNRVIGITRILNLIVNILIIINSRKIKTYFNSELLDIIYDLFIIGTSLGYLALGSMMMQRMIVYFSHTQFIMLGYALCYLYRTRKQAISQLLQYALMVLFIFVSYSSFIYHCEDNVGAYVSYFQTDLHSLKDELRDAAFDQ